MFPGFDVSEWDSHMVWLWRRSNLRFAGFYLAHSATGTHTLWTPHWQDMKDLGWGLLPLWVPFKDTNIDDMKTSNGTTHGQDAVKRAQNANLERGAAIYLDIEKPIFDRQGPGFANYVRSWINAVRAANYVPGVYCSHKDVDHLLDADFRSLNVAVFPFSIPDEVRAKWDDEHFELTPAVAKDWPVGENRNWPLNTLTIGCQFDWFKKGRKRTGFHWPDAEGKPNGFRDVDWDMAKVFDPSHPRAASVVASASDRDNRDWVRVFVVHVGGLDYLQRTFTGQFTRAENLGHSPGSIGPKPPPELNGFDSASASAVSRRHLYCDLFLLGQDGYVRTIWATDRETFPAHRWPLNPAPCPLARRGSPISAVSRALDQLDVFYVTRDHQLATQWWHPLAPDWAKNQRTLKGPLVAGGSNLAVLPGPGDTVEDQLDVFYVSLDYTRPSTDPHWDDFWQVVHATWSTTPDWRLTPIPGLTGVAASSGVAAVHDSTGALHLVVQSRDRLRLRHAALQPREDATWDLHDGPGPLSTDALASGQRRASWWMSLQLFAFNLFRSGNSGLPVQTVEPVQTAAVLLVGMTSAAQLAWSIYLGDHWSPVETAAAPFATSRPLSLARLGSTTLSIIGISEDGETVTRLLSIDDRNGIARLSPR